MLRAVLIFTGLIFVAAGLIALQHAAQMWHEEQRFLANAMFADGIVVRQKEIIPFNPRSRRTYRAVVQFHAGGRTYEFTAGSGSNIPPYIGKRKSSG